MSEKPSKKMIAAVLVVLRQCAQVGLPFQEVNLKDPEAVMLYAQVLEEGGMTPEMLIEGKRRVLTMDRFPTPRMILDAFEKDIDAADDFNLACYQLPGKEPFVGLPGMTEEQVIAEYERREAQKAIPRFTEDQKAALRERSRQLKESPGEEVE